MSGFVWFILFSSLYLDVLYTMSTNNIVILYCNWGFYFWYFWCVFRFFFMNPELLQVTLLRLFLICEADLRAKFFSHHLQMVGTL